jgi:2-C-methyl-D-erythritol 2,4-cyclodiphosphate synthase
MFFSLRGKNSVKMRPASLIGDKLLGQPGAHTYIGAMVHVGIGYDVHQLVAGRKLVLGGVEIPFVKGLDGHSDADVLMHAICDAVLGALGEADIGHFFPNTDPRWKGAPSKVFLEEAARQAKFLEARIVNVDATIIAQQPKLFPHIAKMKINIAEALGINVKKIGIKATTNELMGFIGREEGMAAMAVASVDLKETEKFNAAEDEPSAF